VRSAIWFVFGVWSSRVRAVCDCLWAHRSCGNWQHGCCVTSIVFTSYSQSYYRYSVASCYSISHFHFSILAVALPSYSTSLHSYPRLSHHRFSPSHSRIHHSLYPFSCIHSIPAYNSYLRGTMSSITPPSFVDDGSSFEQRIPHSLHPAHISNWIRSSSSDTTWAYTGSYIDDGADMLVPSRRAPGFGAINPKFYKQRKRREKEERGAWNDDIQKAVAGDIGRSLEKMRGIGGVEVKKIHSGGTRVKDKKKDTVTIPLPPKWGTIVIKAEDGRVIVVDEDGEFDSGPKVQEQVDAEKKWVKAPSTIDLPPPLPSPKHNHTKRRHKHVLEPVKALTPIPESDEYEDIYEPSGGEDPMSPTGFFMSGGVSGWPSPVLSSIASPRKSSKPSSSINNSPVRSLPGSWPSPPHSPTKYSDLSTSLEQSWSKKSSRSGKSCKSLRHGGDDASTKTYSTYKPPVVEDTLDTWSDRASVVKDGGWGGSQKRTIEERGGSQKGSVGGWGGSTKSSQDGTVPDSFPTTAPTAIQNWVARTISETSSRKSRSRSHRSHAPSESSWDGFEKPKTMSEVSVVGTESERSWGGSQPSRRSDGSEHRSHRSSRRGSQAGSGDSEQDWESSQKANVDGWAGKSESGSGYANGYDEDDSTYLNDNWSGVRVRVRSTRGSIGGWE
jgi:hypothetical protein